MEPTFSRDVYSSPTRQLAVSQYMSKVYLWMTMGILLTGFVAYGVSTSEEILTMILTNKILFYGLIIAEFALVIFLSAGINKMNSLTATAMFLLYAAINGATLSIFSLIYTSESIQSAFFTTTVAFAGLSAFGFVTKRDLGPVGSFCTMGLFGLVGFGLLSIFFPSMMGTTASKIYGLVGIIVFAGLTAYDTQAIKNMAPSARDSEQFQKGAVLGALKLYLDFINLFLFILRMSGDRRR
ncbi:Bax inhibitor-1/YccA family protein [Peredibacter starrii]|uniref:Bax inhibitor-1/YccA family protein n=1 Tax=Peredibacter starrii TaxID=28202 RepID=A0AAX4HUP5_9BACT|nr:Bax inhibitor-1/YccA family protein [Peredibacter starrii]WPU67019.1 Bax inhibitor-1/YccA family protein [Peredibacter starrii]